MAITTLSMVLTVFVLNLHHITDRPVPHWVKRLVLVYLARMMGICIKLDEDSDGGGSHSSKVPKTKNRRHGGPLGNHVTFRRTSVRLDDSDERTAIIELQPVANSSVNQSPLHHANGDTERTSLMHDKVYSDSESISGSPARGFNYGTASSSSSNPANQRRDTKQLEQEWAKDWRRVAEVFDRLFFWLFLLAILISTLVLFHPLSDAYMKRGPPPHS